jgi:hypothetical protein
MRSPYPMVRLGRGVVAATASTLLLGTPDHMLEAIALSESIGAASDIASMMPYFGGTFWMVVLWPYFTSMYHELYLFNTKERHVKELRLLAGTILGISAYYLASSVM